MASRRRNVLRRWWRVRATHGWRVGDAGYCPHVPERKVAVIPAPTTPILGRVVEFAQVTDLLWNPDVRLVSLLGPGGIGKTRLAVEVAWESARRNRIRRWRVVRRSGVGRTIRSSPRPPSLARSASSTWARDTTSSGCARRFADRDMLLVLDNFEQVTPNARFVAELLAAAPRLSILVTSRRSLAPPR